MKSSRKRRDRAGESSCQVLSPHQRTEDLELCSPQRGFLKVRNDGCQGCLPPGSIVQHLTHAAHSLRSPVLLYCPACTPGRPQPMPPLPRAPAPLAFPQICHETGLRGAVSLYLLHLFQNVNIPAGQCYHEVTLCLHGEGRSTHCCKGLLQMLKLLPSSRQEPRLPASSCCMCWATHLGAPELLSHPRTAKGHCPSISSLLGVDLQPGRREALDSAPAYRVPQTSPRASPSGMVSHLQGGFTAMVSS